MAVSPREDHGGNRSVVPVERRNFGARAAALFSLDRCRRRELFQVKYNLGMRVLVTGATGLIGNAIAIQLVERGHQVRALVRDPDRARALLPGRVALHPGDVTQPDTLPPAMREIDWVFHAAGMPEQWQRDEKIFDRV